MRYSEVDKEELREARPGLLLVERVTRETHEPLALCLYGITTNAGLVKAAHEAIVGQFDEEEESEQRKNEAVPTEVAVSISLNSDTLYYLTGSGLLLQEEAFSYLGGKDGARRSHLENPRPRPRVTLDDFTVLAIADDDTWLDDFLTAFASKAAPKAAPAKAIERDRKAVTASIKTPSKNNAIDGFLNS
jgi:hypothetical protein